MICRNTSTRASSLIQPYSLQSITLYFILKDINYDLVINTTINIISIFNEFNYNFIFMLNLN